MERRYDTKVSVVLLAYNEEPGDRTGERRRRLGSAAAADHVVEALPLKT